MKKKTLRRLLATSERGRTALHMQVMNLLGAQNRHEVEQAAFDAQLLAAGLIRIDHLADRLKAGQIEYMPDSTTATLAFELKPADEFFESFLSKLPGLQSRGW